METWEGVWHTARCHLNVCSFLPGLRSSKGDNPVGVAPTALGDHHQIMGAAETMSCLPEHVCSLLLMGPSIFGKVRGFPK